MEGMAGKRVCFNVDVVGSRRDGFGVVSEEGNG